MKPCSHCPCKPTTPEGHRALLRSRLGTICESGGFPCHDKHPQAHALLPNAVGNDGKYTHTDCAGYKLWGLPLKEKL